MSDLVARRLARPGPLREGTNGVAILEGLEVAVAVDPGERGMRAVWRARVGNSSVRYLLVADDPNRSGWLRVLGPALLDAPIRSVPSLSLARSIRDTVDMGGLESVRYLAEDLNRLSGQGLYMKGLLSRYTVEVWFKENVARWSEASGATSGLDPSDGWRTILAKFGYRLKQLPDRGYLAHHQGQPVAIVHPKSNSRAFTQLDNQGRPPEGLLVRDCRTHGARYGLLAHEGRFRLFETVSTQKWLDIDARLLGTYRKPFLALLSPLFLSGNGFAELQAEARRLGTVLLQRLDKTIRFDALPALAAGLGQWVDDHNVNIRDDQQRQELEQAALTVMFRLLFILYAESSNLLPMDPSKSLTGLVAEAASSDVKLSNRSTALWCQFAMLVQAIHQSKPAWDVPVHNSALFAPSDVEGAGLLERMELSDPHFAKLLTAVGWDSDSKRGVNYSSLEIGQFGHLYETLLSLRLSMADRPLRYKPSEIRYVSDGTEPEVQAQGLLWQTNEGGPNARDDFYIPAELVEHLVRGAVVPSFERHLEKVREIAATNPDKAAQELFSFSVLDPACGSARFLVQIVDTLADMTLCFLAETPLPRVVSDLDRLRAGVSVGAGVDDATLLRRLLLKHCIFGVDVSPMGAASAIMSLWLASFVPGLSLSYLSRNVIVGDSLIGVATPATVVSKGSLTYNRLLTALNRAVQEVTHLADIDDRTPEEVDKSKLADTNASAATKRVQKLFDLQTAQGFGVDTEEYIKEHAFDVMAGHMNSSGVGFMHHATQLARHHRFLHWPLAFPHVFDPGREQPGFDVVIGKPPWESAALKPLSFYRMHQPGIDGLPKHDRVRAIGDLIRNRPELSAQLDQERQRVAAKRQALAKSEHAQIASGPDLCGFSCQRYRQLTRQGGSMGVVLPRSAFINSGSYSFRDWLFSQVTTERVDFLKNRGKWILDAHPMYSVALVVAKRKEPDKDHRLVITGMATSIEDWRRQSSDSGVHIPASAFGLYWIIPLVKTQTEANLLAKVRTGNPFPFGEGASPTFRFRVEELHETYDRRLWAGSSDSLGNRPLWKGNSFYQYDPHGEGVRWCPASDAVKEKVRKPRPGSRSLIAQLVPEADRRLAVLTELDRARVAFRDITHRTNSRTMIACLVPPGVFLTNTAHYLTFVNGDEMTQAVCLGVMNSIPFDWQARRFVEIHLNSSILKGLIVPPLNDQDFHIVARSASRLSTVDDRFTQFAEATGVEIGPLDDGERQRLRVEIDALVARAWSLTSAELEFMCDDFSTDAVSEQYRTDLLNRFGELI